MCCTYGGPTGWKLPPEAVGNQCQVTQPERPLWSQFVDKRKRETTYFGTETDDEMEVEPEQVPSGEAAGQGLPGPVPKATPPVPPQPAEEAAGQSHGQPKKVQKKRFGEEVTSLDQLPDTVWEVEPNDTCGLQFWTEVGIGMSKHSVMLDGGSSVNSTTEELWFSS